MSVTRPFILAAALVVAASAVQSQGVNLVDRTAQRPASLFPDSPGGTSGQTPSVLSLPDASRGAEARPGGVPPSGAQPWAFAPAKPISAADDDSAVPANEVDTTALRYFASQNDLARVTAEIRLLRSKHPGWEPPPDLFNETKSGELEKPLWELFAKHDYEGVRTAMETMRQNNSDYQPSTDLVGKLVLAEANDQLVKAADAQQWGAVIDIAAANKLLLTCSDVDALWRTAEALIHIDDEAHAMEAYRYILTNCSNPSERLATMQKASLLLKSPEELEALIQLGKRAPSGRSEFDSVRLDLIRQEVGDAAAGKPEAAASPSEIEAVTVHARASKDVNDQQLLGWYYYARKDFAQAETWFRMALQAGPSAKPAEGLVLTLRAANKLPEAQQLALQYAPLDHPNRKLMIEVLATALNDPASGSLSSDDLAAFVKAIDDERSSDGAQIYGWYRYKANDFAAAESWFKKSADWQTNESAAIGQVVTAKRLNHLAEYADLVAKYRITYPKIGEFDAIARPSRTAVLPAHHRWGGKHLLPADGGWDKNADAIAKSLHDGNYDQALAMLEERRLQGRHEPAGLSIVHGWALYNKGDWEGAKKVFATAEARSHSADAQNGLTRVQTSYLPPWLR
jgi:tetratricopeptide (TPR) repeat protein